jgi:ribosomal protein S12 methylthiotransferase accessory factor
VKGSTYLVEAASGRRHGLLSPPMLVPASAADVPGIFHASVTSDTDPRRSAGGGVGRDPDTAMAAAVGESLERWAASETRLEVRRASKAPAGRSLRLADCSLHDDRQRRAPGFPHQAAYPDDEWLTEAYGLLDNEPWWVPAALVSLTDDFGALSTSSGLAADPSVTKALLRATQELVERDAYVVTWLHQLGGRQVPAPGLDDDVTALGGRCRAFDLTQDFSPHPVAMVTGTLPLAGAPRHSLGLACRATWAEAVDKAYLEMLQGTVFVGHQLTANPQLRGIPSDAVTGFDQHAIYYAANPELWDELPIHRAARPATCPHDATATAEDDPAGQLHELVRTLTAAGVRLFYREVTTVDCNQLGLRVVRVLSPDLAPLHHNHRWPYLGGRTPDARSRYADAADRAAGPFPSPHPHALG